MVAHETLLILLIKIKFVIKIPLTRYLACNIIYLIEMIFASNR